MDEIRITLIGHQFMGINLNDSKEILNAVNKAGVRHCCGFSYRFITGLTFNEVSGNLQILIKERPIDNNNPKGPKGKVTIIIEK